MKTIILRGATAALALIGAAASAQTVGSVGVAAGTAAGPGAGVSLDADANVRASTADPAALEPGSSLKSATRKSRRIAPGAGTAGSATANGKASAGERTPDGR